MKERIALFTSLFLIALATGFTNVSSASWFLPYGVGEYRTSAWAEVDGAGGYNYDSDIDSGVDDVNSQATASVSDPNLEASGSGHGSYWSGANEIVISIVAFAEGWSEDSTGDLTGHGDSNTVNPGVTNGVFYEISPGTGENVGDPLYVNYTWMADVQVYADDGSVELNGGFVPNKDMAITLNDYLTTGNPSPGSVKWSHSEVEVSSGDWSDTDSGFFLAHIGDIIGIHLGVDADLSHSGEGLELQAVGSQYMTLETSPVPIPSAVWLLGSGLIGIVGIRRKFKT